MLRGGNARGSDRAAKSKDYGVRIADSCPESGGDSGKKGGRGKKETHLPNGNRLPSVASSRGRRATTSTTIPPRRLSPPPPPPPPPPRGRCWRGEGRALILRPFRSVSLRVLDAVSASPASTISTIQNPRPAPEGEDKTTLALPPYRLPQTLSPPSLS